MEQKGLEFSVNDAGGKERIFKSFDAACGFAISIAASCGKEVHLDVLVWDKKAARAWGGDEGVERYNEDPETSVFDRFVIKADCIGSVP